MKFRHSIRAVSGVPLVVDLKRRFRNSLNEGMNEYDDDDNDNKGFNKTVSTSYFLLQDCKRMLDFYITFYIISHNM